MHGGVCGCAEVHGQVNSSTWRCAEVCGLNRGMQRCTEGYRGAQMYVEVHGEVPEVQGGRQRDMWRWTESVQRYTEDCIEACRGM